MDENIKAEGDSLVVQGKVVVRFTLKQAPLAPLGAQPVYNTPLNVNGNEQSEPLLIRVTKTNIHT